MATFIIRDRLTGRVKVDLSSRITKQLGIISTGNSAGSIVVPGFSGGSPWWSWIPDIEFVTFNLPSITVSGNTLSWSTPPRSISIVYGIY